MYTERQENILKILAKHPAGITSEAIAKLCGVSSKTIRTDIKAITSELSASIAIIHTSTRKGYSIDIMDQQSLDKLLQQQDVQSFEGKNRDTAILNQLILTTLTGIPLKQQDLADQFYLSLSTLKISLKTLTPFLNKYHLSIDSHKNLGMLLEGDERNLRSAVYTGLFESNMPQSCFPQGLCSITVEELRQILIHVTSAYGMVIPDDSLYRLAGYLWIALIRSAKEHSPKYMLRESKKIEAQEEFSIASAIFDEVYHRYELDVPTNEIYYLSQHLIASKKYTPTSKDFQTDTYIQTLVDEMLNRVYQIVGMNLKADQALITGLCNHLKTVIPRIRFHVHSQNEILDVIKNEYPLAFQIGIIASKVIEEHEHLPISEAEIGFIAVHFGAAMSRSKTDKMQKKRQAIIVCGSGMGTATLLKARLKEFCEDILSIEAIIPGYQLAETNLDHIDLVISTMPQDQLPKLSAKDQDKLLIVRHFLDEVEMKELRQHLIRKESISVDNIEKFFHRECFTVDKSFATKEEVLRYMTKNMEDLGLMDHDTSQSIFERESAAPTELGNLLAIPHPIENHTSISSISVCILKEPILWTQYQVQAVFLLSIAKSDFYLWEPIFLKLFNYLTKENGIHQILSYPDYDTFIHDFKKKF